MRLTLLFVLLLATAAHAESGVLVEHIPKGATTDSALRLTKQALLNRGWTLTGGDEHSVSASMSRQTIRVDLRISVNNGALSYEGTAQRRPMGGNAAQSGPLGGSAPFPRNWIENLRRDISNVLAVMPD